MPLPLPVSPWQTAQVPLISLPFSRSTANSARETSTPARNSGRNLERIVQGNSSVRCGELSHLLGNRQLTQITHNPPHVLNLPHHQRHRPACHPAPPDRGSLDRPDANGGTDPASPCGARHPVADIASSGDRRYHRALQRRRAVADQACRIGNAARAVQPDTGRYRHAQ